MPDQKAKKIALDMIRFIDASPTAAHAVQKVASRLEAAGFKRLEERDKWAVAPGDEFYVVRRHSAIIVCRVGQKPTDETGFRIVGAHTDAPGFRLKPNALYSKNGYAQLGVEIYGGPILATWTDRDLGLAGRLVVKRDDGSAETVLMAINRPVCRIPTIAIHLSKDDVNKEGLKLDKQENLPPVIGIGDEEALEEFPFKKALAESADVDPENVVDYRLEVIDTQPGALGGLNDEFVFAGRIDNLASCHAAIEALIKAPKDAPFTQTVALFDNEEVGSVTLGGAASRFLDNVMERLCLSSESPRESYFRAVDVSLMVSADGAHALNPNYADAHDPRHQPILNGGPVMKVNAMERYTSDTDAVAHLRRCAERAGVPLQVFVSRTDRRSGSTIGPMTASRLGIKSVDIGTPMISMHSVREMGGTNDQLAMIKLLTEHFS